MNTVDAIIRTEINVTNYRNQVIFQTTPGMRVEFMERVGGDKYRVKMPNGSICVLGQNLVYVSDL